MSEFPAGWTRAALGDLADFTNGKAFKKEEWLEAGKPIIRIQNLNNPEASFNYADDSHEDKYLVRNGDLLVSWSASLGVYYWAGQDAWLNQHIFRVHSLRGCDKGFLKYALQTSIDDFYAKAHGMGMVHITKGNFESHQVALPPLAEQARIAQKIDELLAQVDTLKARIDAIPALLKRFRQSVLAAAVSGRLTEEWREKNTGDFGFVLNPKAKALSIEELTAAEELLTEPLPTFWKKYSLEQLVEPDRGIPYGIVQTGSAVEKGIPTVRCGDVKNLFIDTSSLKKVSPEIEHEYKRTRLKGGEVLLAIRGSVGNVGVVPAALRDCNISREVAMIPTLPSVLPFYLACLLQSPLGQQLLIGKVRGVAQKGINLADVRRLPVALPPYAEQTEIVHRVEKLFAFADQLEAKVNSAKSRIDNLTQSILAKAFRGELVPQDPNDEPASVLLGRIKAQRATAPKAKRARKDA